MSKDKMIDAVEKVIIATAQTAKLEKKGFPTPREFAVEVVGFFYRAAKEDNANVQEAK